MVIVSIYLCYKWIDYYSNDGNNSEINVESEVVTRSHTANKEQ